jgi:Domain of unknown function (DUF1707)
VFTSNDCNSQASLKLTKSGWSTKLLVDSISGEAPVESEPGGQLAAAGAGRSHLRAAHSDRELVIEVLKGAFVQGRLTKDEFDARVGQTFTSQTYAELAVVTADIPAGPIEARRQRKPRRQASRQVVAWRTGVVIAAVILVTAFLTGNGPLIYLAVSTVFEAGLIAVAQLLYSRKQRRFGGPSRPRRPLEGQVHL